ncbi:MAG: phosphoribosyltransferase family protein [Bacteroidetes bacterium]|nr:phosphoribosyltransferase family protein [Bacteroidota bacterium]
MKKYLKDLLGLFLPRLCLACGNNRFDHEEYICGLCWLRLPRTRFHLETDNPVSRVFWGRVWLEHATACFYYSKGNKVQHLIHQLKYKGHQELGVFLGEKYGKQLMKVPSLAGADSLIPVPLHPKKQRKRGYNQSEAIARGLAAAMGIEVLTEALVRSRATDTQTRKNRYTRWKNVENIFVVKDSGKLAGKHVILIDDVITTGSTLEACIQAVQQIPGVRVSVVALAYASL